VGDSKNCPAGWAKVEVTFSQETFDLLIANFFDLCLAVRTDG
jgi:hypothetical protein